jgi:hypothetical protein
MKLKRGDEYLVRTRHLKIKLVPVEELNKKLIVCTDEQEKRELTRIISECEEDPENKPWYAPWDIVLKEDESKKIGSFSFNGTDELKAVSFTSEMDETYKRLGYFKEACGAMAEWAFLYDIYFLDTLVDDDDLSSLNFFKSIGFKENGKSELSVVMTKEKAPGYLSTFLCVGLMIGIAASVPVSKHLYGAVAGSIAGALAGYIMDLNKNREKNSYRKERKKKLEL